MTIKVKSNTPPKSLAGAIAAEITRVDRVELEMIGAGAVNQAVKAVAIARTFVSSATHELVALPQFADRVIDGEERTVMKLAAEIRQKHPFVQEPSINSINATREMMGLDSIGVHGDKHLLPSSVKVNVTGTEQFAQMADLVARALQHCPEPHRKQMMAELVALAPGAIKESAAIA